MRAALWMLGALVSFCLMAIGARELSGSVNTFQIMFFRSAIGLVVVVGMLLIAKKKTLLKTDRPGLHLTRNIFHFMGQYGWFLGIGLLPLAEVFALEFTVPLWTAIMASVFLGEKLSAFRILAVILGMTGVAIIVKPGSEIFDEASLIVLGAAVGFAIAHTATKSLSLTDHPMTILFYMCLIQLPMGLGLSLTGWQVPGMEQWFWIVVIGLTALSAHFCTTMAMKWADATVVVTLDFLRLPVIAVAGVLLYQEQFEISLILGGLIMLFGNLLNMQRSRRSDPAVRP